MPVIPDPADFPSVEKESKESPITSGKQKKASAFDFLSKGPQISDNMPPKATKEELETRMKELNK